MSGSCLALYLGSGSGRSVTGETVVVVVVVVFFLGRMRLLRPGGLVGLNVSSVVSSVVFEAVFVGLCVFVRSRFRGLSLFRLQSGRTGRNGHVDELPTRHALRPPRTRHAYDMITSHFY